MLSGSLTLRRSLRSFIGVKYLHTITKIKWVVTLKIAFSKPFNIIHVFFCFQQLRAWSLPSVCFPREARSLWSTSPLERRDVTQSRRRSLIPNESNSQKVCLQKAQTDSHTWVRWSTVLWKNTSSYEAFTRFFVRLE